MTNRKISKTGLITYCIGLVIITVFFLVKEINAVREQEINAFVYNQEVEALDVLQIEKVQTTQKNFQVYASLSSYQKNAKKMTLNYQNEIIDVYTYQHFDDLILGKHYIFEGYIESIDGQNSFVVETISEVY